MYKKYEILKLLVSFLQIVRTKTFIRKRRRRLLTLVTVNILIPSQESKNTKSSSGIYGRGLSLFVGLKVYS
jgi:hypothetical protein